MSDREKAIELINSLPDNRLPYVIGFILGIMASTDNEDKQKETSKQD